MTLRADKILQKGAETFAGRNAVYGDNWAMVGDVMAALHPRDLVSKTKEDHELNHLWYLLIVKLTRFAISGLNHRDSIHDAMVYCAMIESILVNRFSRKKDADIIGAAAGAASFQSNRNAL